MIHPERGKLYLLRGGHILRCHGPYASSDPRRKVPDPPRCFAFADPRRPLDDTPVGYSATAEEVSRELTEEDLSWLPERLAQARVRIKDVGDVEHVIAELSQD